MFWIYTDNLEEFIVNCNCISYRDIFWYIIDKNISCKSSHVEFIQLSWKNWRYCSNPNFIRSLNINRICRYTSNVDIISIIKIMVWVNRENYLTIIFPSNNSVIVTCNICSNCFNVFTLNFRYFYEWRSSRFKFKCNSITNRIVSSCFNYFISIYTTSRNWFDECFLLNNFIRFNKEVIICILIWNTIRQCVSEYISWI